MYLWDLDKSLRIVKGCVGVSFESQVNAGKDISYWRNKGNYCQLRGVADEAEKIVSINTQMKAIKVI